MAGPLLTKKMLKNVERCICKECKYCPSKNCAGCESPATNRVSCIRCFPHSPNFIHLHEDAYA